MLGSKTYPFESVQSSVRSARNYRSEKALLAGLLLLLTAAITSQALPHSNPIILKPKLSLADYLPVDPAGWRGADKPLAETEALAGTVKSILNYDDTVLRVYRKNGMEFVVYVAYWSPGRMPAREIAFHIPDKCWVAAGMKRTAADYNYQRTFDGKPLAPAQYREFDAANTHQKVIYWHIYNGQTIIYNPDGSPSDLSMVTDLLRRGLNQRGEQFFIRVSSQMDFNALWTDPGFQEVMELLVPLGPGLHQSVEKF